MSLQNLAKEFIGAYEGQKYDHAMTILPNIKLELAKAGLIVPHANQKGVNKSDYEAARQVLEVGVLVSIHTGNDDEMNRLVSQLRPFYAPELGLSPSSNENKILALYLLLLVAKNEIAEFHTELDSLTNPEEDAFLSYPIRLERWLMEGSYDKVWSAITQQSQVPAPEFAILAQSLVYTIRSEIAASAERSYTSLPVSNARHLLFLSSDQELADFVSEHPGWRIENGRIYFPDPEGQEAVADEQLPDAAVPNVSSERLIANALGYAREIETII